MIAAQLHTCVLFGGAGFIGSHFARYLLANEMVEWIYLADLQPPKMFIS